MKRPFAFFLCFLITLGAKAQGDTISAINEILAAKQTFLQLLDPQDAKDFGLKNKEELNSLSIGRQFRTYSIGLYAIRKFEPTDDVSRIINGYPMVEVALVNQAGNIRTSIEFLKKDGKWKAIAYGSSREFLLLKAAQDSVPKTVMSSGDLIRIPALHMSFMGVKTSAGWEFYSLQDRPDLELYKGTVVSATKILSMLRPLANKVDERYPD